MPNKTTKKCPRCGEKTSYLAKECDNCHLIFSRLEYASNKEAKKAIRSGEREKVILTSDFPRDLKRWKVLCFCGVGGLFGLHNLYIGRYIKGIFSFLFFFLSSILVLVLDGAVLAKLFSSYLFIPGSIVFIFWIWDFALLCIKKYKVPIALDMPKGNEDGK